MNSSQKNRFKQHTQKDIDIIVAEAPKCAGRRELYNRICKRLTIGRDKMYDIVRDPIYKVKFKPRTFGDPVKFDDSARAMFQELVTKLNIPTPHALYRHPSIMGRFSRAQVAHKCFEWGIHFGNPAIQPQVVMPKYLKEISEKYDEASLKNLALGRPLVAYKPVIPIVNFRGTEVKFGFVTDTHFGSKFFIEKLWDMAIEEFIRQKVDFIVHAGDVTEGTLQHRAGHFYELLHQGYDNQLEYSVKQLSKWSGKWMLLGGNHDEWVRKDAGADIVHSICKQLPNAKHLGTTEGSFRLGPKALVTVYHGGSLSAFTHSYAWQQKVRSISGGPESKPNILLGGHTHKYNDGFDRNIHTCWGGCIQLQTDYMKSKNIEAHPMFVICETVVNDKGVSAFGAKKYPFYAS